MLRSVRKPSLLVVAAVAVGVAALVAAGCGGGDSDQEAADERVEALQQQLTNAQKDSKYWQQLTSLLKPVVADPSMTDHRAFMLPSGAVVALHFDNLDLDRAKNLSWVALGIPGRFCKDDQQRVEKQFGNGFTHFHDLKNKSHGGKPGAEGVWFVHVSVRDFKAPWGLVDRGIDHNFMPTKAPVCG